MYMSSLLMLSVYVMSSTYYLGIYILCAHYLKWSLISSFLADNTNVIHILYIFYHVQLSFHTLSIQMHIVHVICMLSAHVHIISLSSLTLLVYPIIHNLVSAHCLHTCILSMSSACCLHMYTSFPCHLEISPEISLLCHPHIVCTSSACHPHVVCTSSARDFNPKNISS